MLSISMLVITIGGTSASAANIKKSDLLSSTAVTSNQVSTVQAAPMVESINYHSVRFSIDFMETIMAGKSEPRVRFYKALEAAIGARVIFDDFWSDHIVIEVIDKQLTPEEAKVVKDKINSLQWLHETYNVPMDQEIITDIYWFDRWS